MAHGYTMVTGRAAGRHGPRDRRCRQRDRRHHQRRARATCRCCSAPAATPSPRGAFAGSRDRPIHWAQESLDQGGMVREFVKWDYELRNFSQLETVVDRALADRDGGARRPRVPHPAARGPRRASGRRSSTRAASRAPRPSADGGRRAASVAKAAQTPGGARAPDHHHQGGGPRSRRHPGAWSRWRRRSARRSSSSSTRYLNFPQDHPLHAGFDATPVFRTARTRSWSSSPTCRGSRAAATRARRRRSSTSRDDPLFARYPVRGFEADVALVGPAASHPRTRSRTRVRSARRRPRSSPSGARAGEAEHRRLREEWAATAKKASEREPASRWRGSRSASATSSTTTTIVVNEYDFDATQGSFTRARQLLRRLARPAGSAGASAPRWAPSSPRPTRRSSRASATAPTCSARRPRRTGSSRAYELPMLTVIFNNRAWNAVKRAVHSFAEGRLGRAERRDAALRSRSRPRLRARVPRQRRLGREGRGSRGVARCAGARAQGRAHERRQALLNVICKKPA